MRSEILKHHHIGGGGQATATPGSLHRGSGGAHNLEKVYGCTGVDSSISKAYKYS